MSFILNLFATTSGPDIKIKISKKKFQSIKKNYSSIEFFIFIVRFVLNTILR
jgi:hypothetical protein